MCMCVYWGELTPSTPLAKDGWALSELIFVWCLMSPRIRKQERASQLPTMVSFDKAFQFFLLPYLPGVLLRITAQINQLHSKLCFQLYSSRKHLRH